jgi:hypothetical protein
MKDFDRNLACCIFTTIHKSLGSYQTNEADGNAVDFAFKTAIETSAKIVKFGEDYGNDSNNVMNFVSDVFDQIYPSLPSDDGIAKNTDFALTHSLKFVETLFKDVKEKLDAAKIDLKKKAEDKIYF